VTVEEVTRLIDAARTLTDRTMLMVLYSTGMRNAEMRSLQVKNIKVLSRVFRGKVVAGLRAAIHTGALRLPSDLQRLTDERAFAAWLRTLFRHDWVV
jgi:integrase